MTQISDVGSNSQRINLCGHESIVLVGFTLFRVRVVDDSRAVVRVEPPDHAFAADVVKETGLADSGYPHDDVCSLCDLADFAGAALEQLEEVLALLHALVRYHYISIDFRG